MHPRRKDEVTIASRVHWHQERREGFSFAIVRLPLLPFYSFGDSWQLQQTRAKYTRPCTLVSFGQQWDFENALRSRAWPVWSVVTRKMVVHMQERKTCITLLPHTNGHCTIDWPSSSATRNICSLSPWVPNHPRNSPDDQQSYLPAFSCSTPAPLSSKVTTGIPIHSQSPLDCPPCSHVGSPTNCLILLDTGPLPSKLSAVRHSLP